MKPSTAKSLVAGFGLLELMIAMALGLIIAAGMVALFLAQRQVYRGATSQALMQDADNAISATVTPVIRGAGFYGCGGISNGLYTSSLTGMSTPLTYNATSAVQGFYSALPASLVDGANNDSSSSDWSPALDSSLTGNMVEQGSDVLVVMGAAPGSIPTSITQTVGASAASFTYTTPPANEVYQTGAQLVALSDCNKSSVFEASGISSGSNTVTIAAGPGIQFNAGSQFIPVQQTAFFVAKNYSGGNQSALFEAVMTPGAGGLSGSKWVANPIVPGVLAMKALYGLGPNGQATTYVNASAVASNGGWNAVTSVRIAFLIEGTPGSAVKPSATTESYSLFNGAYTVTVPSDSRMRHVFYMTVNTRNTTLQ